MLENDVVLSLLLYHDYCNYYCYCYFMMMMMMMMIKINMFVFGILIAF